MFESLTRRALAFSHPEYPWLSKVYSASSRIPCFDLSQVFVPLLENHDIPVIKRIMRAVLQANPGFGTDACWIDREIDKIDDIDFHKFVEFFDPIAFLELKAYFIIRSKDGGGREFWLADETPWHLAHAFAVHKPTSKILLDNLRVKANRFLKEMKVDTAFWKDYPYFSSFSATQQWSGSEEILVKIKKLPPGARMQLGYFCRRGLGTASQTSNYELRKFGLDIEAGVLALREQNLIAVARDAGQYLKSIPKSEMLAIATEKNIALKTSMNKAEIAKVLISSDAELENRLMNYDPVFTLHSAWATEIEKYFSYAEAQVALFALLAFA